MFPLLLVLLMGWKRAFLILIVMGVVMVSMAHADKRAHPERYPERTVTTPTLER